MCDRKNGQTHFSHGIKHIVSCSLRCAYGKGGPQGGEMESYVTGGSFFCRLCFSGGGQSVAQGCSGSRDPRFWCSVCFGNEGSPSIYAKSKTILEIFETFLVKFRGNIVQTNQVFSKNWLRQRRSKAPFFLTQHVSNGSMTHAPQLKRRRSAHSM